MTRVHAFGDDALGDLDAVGLVEALRAGKVSAAELVEAAIARTEAVNPALNGLAYEAFDRARVRAAASRPYGGYFDGVPSFIKDNVAVAGMPTMQGTDAWDPRASARRWRIREALSCHRPCAARQVADVGVRFLRRGRACADRPRAATRGISSSPPADHRRAQRFSSRRVSCPSRMRWTAAARSVSRRPAPD